jgi:hypothetical protein
LPEELRAALAEHFSEVALFRQHDWLTSAVLDDDLYADDGSTSLHGVDVRKVVGREPGSELLTVALASNARLPDASGAAVLTHDLEIRELVEGYERLQIDHDRLQVDRAGVAAERAESKRAADRAMEAARQSRAAADAAERRVLELESSEALHRQTIYRQQRELEDVLARVGTEAEFAKAQAAAKQLLETQRRIAELERVIAERERVIAEMEATRVWAVGTSFWRLRDFVLRRR